MATRASIRTMTSGSRSKTIENARLLAPGSEAQLHAKANPDAPKGAVPSYQAKGQRTFYKPGIYPSGKKSRAHGYLGAGGTRTIETGAQAVVKQLSGRSLF